MPGYANWGNAFWQGANSGANMATKWVNAYDWGDRYKHGNEFKEGSAEAMDTYNKSMEAARAIQDEGQRQKAIQDAIETRNNTIYKLGMEHYGDKGVDVGNKFIAGQEAGDANINNSALRSYGREQFNANPSAFNTTGGKYNPYTGSYNNGSSAAQQIARLIYGAKSGMDDPNIQGMMATAGISLSPEGALNFTDEDGETVPINMQLLASRMVFAPQLYSSLQAYMNR